MEKLILKKQRYKNNDNMCRIRVRGSIYTNIEELAEKTNMSITDLASILIEFAMQHTEVQE